MLESSDPDERALGKEELPALRERRDALEAELKVLLVPKDPNDEKNVILEIRAGAGGDEAGLFAEEVLQMYLRYADRKGWKAELVDMSPGNAGGIKDATVTLSGDAVYSSMKYESGVHRVQRVPATEAQGRIHTSTITVAVMPEAEDVDVQLNPADIEMQVMRSTGAGGQSVNTTDSAVRLIHKPTGIVVKCQQEKSQTKNRTMAMRMLRAKLYELEQERITSERDSLRRGQVGTGDRSEKIRTYNFPQDRLTDHRIGMTWHNLAGADGRRHRGHRRRLPDLLPGRAAQGRVGAPLSPRHERAALDGAPGPRLDVPALREARPRRPAAHRRAAARARAPDLPGAAVHRPRPAARDRRSSPPTARSSRGARPASPPST